MNDSQRDEVLKRLATIRRLTKEVRELAPMPSIETNMRYCEIYCKSAQWYLGEGDRFQFELD